MHFIIDKDTEFSCVSGEFYPYDGTITINLAKIDSVWEYVNTEVHEWIHKLIEETGTETSEDQDHYIIPKLLF